MLTASLITVLSSLLLVNAQNAQIETESIEAQFENAYLVPDLISSFDPIGYLTVSFGGDAVAPGTPLTVDGAFLDSIPVFVLALECVCCWLVYQLAA